MGERLRLAMSLPCRSAAEHAPLSDNIEAADQKETYYTPPLVNVIKFACNGCVEDRIRVTEGCQGCLARPCVETCPKGAVSVDWRGCATIDEDKCIHCGRCVDVCSYHAIIRQKRPCAEACGMDAIGTDQNGKAEIDYDKCVSCGMCQVNCPFGAISDKSQIFQMIRAMQAGERVLRRGGPGLRRSVRAQGDARPPARGDEKAGLCRRGGGGRGRRPVRRAGGGVLFAGGAGRAAVYGHLMLPGLVVHGQDAVPRLRQVHLHGADAHDADRPADQAPQSQCQGWPSSVRAPPKSWRPCARMCAARWTLC